MSPKKSWRGMLVGLLCVALATPACTTHIGRAPAPQEAIMGYKGSGATVGVAVAGAAGVTAIIAIVLTHKKQITGCVNARQEGMGIIDEHDKQTYELLGSRTDFKAGERVRLQVKKIKLKDKGSAPVWQVEKLVKNYGSCG
jgi:hypothetical protein